MNTKQRSANALKRFLAPLREVMEDVDALDEVGSIEQAGREAESRLNKLREDEERAKARVVAAEKKADEAEKKTSEARRNAKATAEQIVERANQQAKTIVDEATQKAKAAEQEGRDSAKRLRAGLAQLERQRDALAEEITTSERKLTNIHQRIADLRSKLG